MTSDRTPVASKRQCFPFAFTRTSRNGVSPASAGAGRSFFTRAEACRDTRAKPTSWSPVFAVRSNWTTSPSRDGSSHLSAAHGSVANETPTPSCRHGVARKTVRQRRETAEPVGRRHLSTCAGVRARGTRTSLRLAGVTGLFFFLAFTLASTHASAGSLRDTGEPATAEDLAAVMLAESRIPSTVRAGTPRCWAALERAPGGCAAELESYARAFSEAGEVYGIDAYLLVALAWHESRWVAGANGAADERSILQIHPRNRNARGLAVFDDREWLVCRKQIGSCQYEVVFTAAAMLAAARERCGSVTGAIAAWNTGRCTSERGLKYAARVIRTRDRFAGGAS